MYDNAPNEGMRCILQLVEQVKQASDTPLTLDQFNVRANTELPGLDYDIYISTGGPGSPLPSDEAWEAPYFELIDDLFAWNQTQEPRKFVFLICHSFQLVMRHLGLGHVSKRKSTSFGIFPIHQTDEAHADPLFVALPEPFYAVDSRDYQVTEPNLDRLKAIGATVLRLEKVRPHVPLERAIMAVRFSDEIFGTQFHPEADGDGMLRYFLTDEKRNQIIENYGEAKYTEMVSSLRDPDKIERTESVILPTFLRQAIDALSLVAVK